MPLTITTRTVDGTAVIYCEGAIVFGEGPTTLHITVKNLLPRTRRVVINLIAVPYLDSAGVGALFGIYTSVTGVGAEMLLANASPPVYAMLQTSRLICFVGLCGTEEEALQSFCAKDKDRRPAA